MVVEQIVEGVLSLGVVILVGYGIWNWRRGRLQRKSTKAAVIFGLIAIIADVVLTLVSDFGPANPSDGVAVGLGLIMILCTFVCIGALLGAVVCLVIRGLRHPKPALRPSPNA